MDVTERAKRYRAPVSQGCGPERGELLGSLGRIDLNPNKEHTP